MLSSLFQSLDRLILYYSKSNPWTNIYGIARSFLAFGLLITLVFTGYENLFPHLTDYNNNVLFDFQKISIFKIFESNIEIAFYFSMFVLIWVISGFTPQISCLFHWWIAYSFVITCPIIEGGDQISMIITLLLIPVCIMDNRINHWYRSKEHNKNSFIVLFIWSFYLIISLQVSIIYLNAAIAKISVEEWSNGTATYYWFTHSIFGISEGKIKTILIQLFSNITIVAIFTWGTIVFELLLSGWLLMSRNKWNWKFIFISGVLFHVGIALIHGLVSFMFTMIGALILYTFKKENNFKLKYIWKKEI